MAYGFQVNKSGTSIADNVMIGGRIYVDLIYKETETSGTTTTYTYTAVPGHTKLRIQQVGGGTHTYALSTNGSGQAVITLTATANPSTLSVPFTLLLVFATETTETGYGVLTTNDAGERIISAVYPVPEFIGKLTFGGTATSSYGTGEGSYVYNNHRATSSIGASRERFILYAMPQTNEDVWITAPSHISSAVSGSFDLDIGVITPSGTPYYLPEAYIFGLTGLTASSDAYGMRVLDDVGNVTFDSGRNHLVLAGLENIASYPTSTGTINSFAPTSLSAINLRM